MSTDGSNSTATHGITAGGTPVDKTGVRVNRLKGGEVTWSVSVLAGATDQEVEQAVEHAIHAFDSLHETYPPQ